MQPIGNYVLVGVATPDGYVTAEEVPFIVKDTGEIQTGEGMGIGNMVPSFSHS